MKPLLYAGQPPSLLIPVLGSLGANFLLFVALGQGSNRPVPVVKPPELIFDRVVMEKQNKSKKPIFHPIKPIPPPKPPEKKDEPKLVHKTPPHPEGAHNRLLAAKDPTPAPSNEHFVVPAGGNAPVGVPTDAQRPGNNVENPPKPPPPPPPPPPPVVNNTPTTKVVTPPPPPPPAPPVKHEDPPPPPPPSPPKPKGETREAKPDHQESVEIPESLKSQSFKSFVRVRVEIGGDGKFKVILRTSSGNTDIDKLVVDTLNKWTWKPALKDGDAVESVQQFRFNFVVE